MKTIIDIYTAAKLLGISKQTAINYAVDGYFPSWRASPRRKSKILCYREDILEYLSKRQAEGT